MLFGLSWLGGIARERPKGPKWFLGRISLGCCLGSARPCGVPGLRSVRQSSAASGGDDRQLAGLLWRLTQPEACGRGSLSCPRPQPCPAVCRPRAGNRRGERVVPQLLPYRTSAGREVPRARCGGAGGVSPVPLGDGGSASIFLTREQGRVGRHCLSLTRSGGAPFLLWAPRHLLRTTGFRHTAGRLKEDIKHFFWLLHLLETPFQD